MYDFFADSSAIGEKEIIIRAVSYTHLTLLTSGMV